MEPHVIAENEWVIAIDKPAGLIVHSDGRTEEPSLVDWILKARPELTGVGEPWLSPQGNWHPRPGIVHRLDRTTSGVMLLAKTNEVYAHLKKEFKERRVEKTYRAIVHGHPDTESGRIVAAIERSTDIPKRWYAQACEESHARAAVTEWKVLSRDVDVASGENYSVLSVSPKTGRTHQIRVHMAHIGHPLVSDHIYGSDHAPILGFSRPALHAESISACMPSGERATYISPPSPGFIA